MNHYPRHVGDYLRKTIGLTMLQDGAYTRLIDLYYSNDAPLTLDIADLYESTRCRSKADRDAVDFVLRRYFVQTPAGWANDRCDEEIAKYRDKTDKAKAAGQASGKARRSTEHEQTLNGRSPKVEQTLNQPEPEPEPEKTKAEGERVFGTHAKTPPLPGTLRPETWAEWRSHLASKGKGLTPPTERLQLVRLAEHPDPDKTVQDAIAAGHASLPPPGGWPSQQEKQTHLDARAKVAAEIWKGHDDGKRTNDITGESERIT